ncbi:G5 domain-containing protein [Neobacillus sp. YX16]|uniref:G5 domain-containing protein n=1 Tax=Neobacillus sp. YX16 TaxID=3047874 RepID=UPI0024C3C038|nr:G5 domain-containing protein [Neobacillus sp. YX16]WHZ01905.1 G5 domain-containing protein [Neobacillus sp. YX16]
MNNNQQFIKLFVVLFLSTAFIFSFSHFGAKAFEGMTNDGNISGGTMIGFLDISGKTDSEAIALLEESYIEWVQNTKMGLEYSEKMVPLDLNFLHLDASKTVASIKGGKKNPAIIEIDMLQLEEQLQIIFPEIDTRELELTKLTADINNRASQFEKGSFTFNLTRDYLLTAVNKDVVISEAVIELKIIPTDLETIISNNPSIAIGEETIFSLLELAKEQKIETSSSLNIIATGIYQAILPTDFIIAERNISSELPVYAEVGYEAMVNYENGADLVIRNPNKTKYNLALQLENGKFKVSLIGESLFYDYVISKKDEQQIKAKTIVQYSPLLDSGDTKVQKPGKNGVIIKVFRDIYQGSQLLKSELISEDYYPPFYRIEVHGLKGTEQTQTSENKLTIEPKSSGNLTPSTSETDQQQPVDGLWGKPNEESK